MLFGGINHWILTLCYVLVCVYHWNPSDAFGAVESVKAASDVYTPAAGTVTAVNEVGSSFYCLSVEECVAYCSCCCVGPG